MDILMKKETRSRGSIKGHYTKYLNDIKITQLYQSRQIFDREMRESYRDIDDDEFYTRMDIYKFAHYDKNFNRLLFILERQEKEIAELKDKKESYNKVEFEPYDKDDCENCPICYDKIHKHTPVYKCKSCKKSCHSHCYLYLPNKSTCPMCRGML